MPKTTIGIDTSLVSTTAQAELGAEFTERHPTRGSGERTWIYVQATGSAFAVGELIAKAADATTYVTVISPASCPPIRCVGFAQHAIAENSYGWVLRKGLGTVKAVAAGVADESALIPGATAGRVVVAAAVTNASVGYTMTAIGVNATGTAYIDCRG